jgi:flagellar basal-body rod protein FlgB
MFEKLEISRMAQDPWPPMPGRGWPSSRENVANADTPGYKAQDIARFRRNLCRRPGLALRATRPGHLAGDAADRRRKGRGCRGPRRPNGNSVSLEKEMVKPRPRPRQEHEMALAIYRATGSDVMRASWAGAVGGRLDERPSPSLSFAASGMEAQASACAMCRRTSPTPTPPATTARR